MRIEGNPGAQNLFPQNNVNQNKAAGSPSPEIPASAPVDKLAPVNPASTDVQLRNLGFTPGEIKDLKRTGKVECETCANRTYQDGSGDPGVSFKSPTKIGPGAAAAAVASHENEHVNRNAAKAAREGKTASSTVRLLTSVCPECGKSYVSGGETMTTIKKKAESQDFADKFMEQTGIGDIGKNIDKNVG